MHPEAGRTALWRAAQLGRANGRVVETGYDDLSAVLPSGGWPRSALVELLVPHGGCGELRLLLPALSKGKQPIVVIQPPHVPSVQGLAYGGLQPDRILWLKPKVTADTLWSTQEALKSGTFGAVLLWQTYVRSDALRRLHLAAKTGESLFFLIRPLSAAMDPSPAELRLALHPAEHGVTVDIIKRRGPALGHSLTIELRPAATTQTGRKRQLQETQLDRLPTLQPAFV
ncbi:translesion DNA synthesis-associated protein ImuA [Paraburkholderia humisilvae]|uniref:translesion DNA synthesis-associated protein ImuA n=1 Tax=Paraburkholderia humisilvae TaxID=627669 RepID=UPI00248464C2|nr:translesion DNA synthesis-associated protein ImuA [Paraburkholderia humisilvae]